MAINSSQAGQAARIRVLLLLAMITGLSAQTAVAPNDNWETMVSGAAAGTVFSFANGVYQGTCDVALSNSITIMAASVNGNNPPVPTVIFNCTGPRVFSISNGATVTLQGVELKSHQEASGTGGCLLISGGANVMVKNSLLSSCRAAGNGGAIHTDSSYLHFHQSKISQASGANGGAIYQSGGNLSITESQITDSTGTNGAALYLDGTVSTYTGQLGTISTSQFESNIASTNGGGIYVNGGQSLVLNDVDFLSNQANGVASFTVVAGGGAIFFNDPSGSALVVQGGSRFVSNIANQGGAIAVLGGSTSSINVLLDGSEFSNNVVSLGTTSSRRLGGAFYIKAQTATLTILGGSNFFNNEAGGYGGAIYALGASTTAYIQMHITASNFTSNTAGFGAGAIYKRHSSLYAGDGSYFVRNKCTSSSCKGGAIYAYNGWTAAYGAALVLTGRVEFSENEGASGGAIGHDSRASTGETHVVDVLITSLVRFANNIASRSGGAIYVDSQDPSRTSRTVVTDRIRILGATFDSNKAVGTSESSFRVDGGGAVFIRDTADVVISDQATFDGNTANMGGSLLLDPQYDDLVSSVEISNGTVFRNNVATSVGGAMCVVKGTATVVLENEVIMESNVADQGGAIGNILGASSVSITARDHVRIQKNVATGQGGGIILADGYLTLDDDTVIAGNSATDGGAVFVDGNLTVGSATLSSNHASQGGAVFSNDIDNDGSSVSFEAGAVCEFNHAKEQGGCVWSSDSRSIVEVHQGAAIRHNTAAEKAGGIYVIDDSPLVLHTGAVCQNNTAARGGCLAQNTGATATLKSGAILKENVAGVDGGAVYVEDVSTLHSDGALFQSNLAHSDGGAIRSGPLASLNVASSTFSDNKAGNGGAICSLGPSTIRASILERNQATGGGAICTQGQATVTISDCRFSASTATADGGCMLVKEKSSLTLRTSTIGPGCVAAQHGGGLAVGDSGTAVLEYDNVFTGNDARIGGGVHSGGTQVQILRDFISDSNTATDGAGIGAFAPVLFAGDNITISRNRARREGGGIYALGGNAQLRIGAERTLTIDRNDAGTNGGGIAIAQVAQLIFEPSGDCPAECEPSFRGDGTCHFECMTANCNWDSGDCDSRFNQAGQAAATACPRDGEESCALFDERFTVFCASQCMTASCDWSKGNSQCNPWKEQMKACPLIDAVMYKSMTDQEELIFLDGGTVNGYGRCNSSTCRPASAAYSEGTWCPGMDDDAIVKLQAGADVVSFTDNGLAWGYCQQKPRVMSRGFNYSSEEFTSALAMNAVQTFQTYPSCGALPLILSNNVAQGNGGGIYFEQCDTASDSSGKCAIGQIRKNDHPALAVQFYSNKASGAGGAIYSECGDFSTCTAFVNYKNGLPTMVGAESSQYVFQFNGVHEAGVYGDTLASSPSDMTITLNKLSYTPGVDVLDFDFLFKDTLDQVVVNDAYSVAVYFCPASSSDCTKSVQRVLYYSYDTSSNGLRSTQSGSSTAAAGQVMEYCERSSGQIQMSIVLQGVSESASPLSFSNTMSCAPCTRTEAMETVTIDGTTVYKCTACALDEYVLNASDPSMQCEACPRGAMCNELAQPECAFRFLGNKCPNDFDSPKGVWTNTPEGQKVLTSCDPGYLLINDPVEASECRYCPALTYSTNIYDGCTQDESNNWICESRPCLDCPAGATCDQGGRFFTPSVEESVWEDVLENDYTVKRLKQCPPGYIVIRHPELPLADQCARCVAGTYSFVTSTYGSLFAAANFTDLAENANLCSECNKDEVTCGGGSDVKAREGFYVYVKPEDDSEVLPAANLGQFEVYKCPQDACLEGGNCTEGREGPACFDCKEGWAMSGRKCRKCDEDEDYVAYFYMTVWALVMPIFMVIWFLVSWRPLFVKTPEELEYQSKESEQDEEKKNKQCCGFFGFVRSVSHQVARVVVSTNITDYVKIVISFLQVVSSFEQTFDIGWPSEFREIWKLGTVLRLDVFSIPGTHCLTDEYSYFDRFQLFTIMPLVVAILLGIPTLFMICSGEQGHKRYKAIVDRFWYSLVFWLFITYPLMALGTIEGLNCRKIGERNLLIVDPRETCPWDPSQTKGGLFVWVVISIIIYPFGVPAFIYGLLVYFGVPDIAEARIRSAVLRRMIEIYTEYSEAKLSTKLASFIGISHSEDRSTQEQIDHASSEIYQKVTKHGKKPFSAEAFGTFLHKSGIQGTDEDDIWEAFKDPRNGKEMDLDFSQFKALLNEVVQTPKGLSGTETIDNIEHSQLLLLCQFGWQRVFDDADITGGSVLERQIKKEIMKEERKKEAKQRAQRRRETMHATSFSGSFGKERAESFSNLSRAPSDPEAKKKKTTVEKLKNMVFNDVPEFNLGPDASRADLLAWILGVGFRFRRAGVFVLPILRWTGESKIEQNVIDRIGFLFDGYQVQYWYFELIDMLRKLLITGVIALLLNGSALQLCLGCVITAAFVLVYAYTTPFSDPQVGDLHLISLVAQALTLFYGITSEIYRLDPKAQAGDGDTTARVALVMLQIMVIVFPVVAAAFPFVEFPNLRKLFCGGSSFEAEVSSLKINKSPSAFRHSFSEGETPSPYEKRKASATVVAIKPPPSQGEVGHPIYAPVLPCVCFGGC